MNKNNDTSQPNPEDRNTESIADELLVDAMLKGHYQDSPQSIAKRVDKACNKMDIEHRNHIFDHWMAKISAAAAVIILGFIFVFNTPPTAHADFAAVLAAFDIGDKTYKININAATDNTPQYQYKSHRRGNTAEHLDGASLYIRQHSYVLNYRTARGQGITRGFDGHSHWLLLHHRRQSVLSDDPNRLYSEVPDYIQELLFMDLRQMLHQIQTKYRLSEPILSLEDGDIGQMQYYVAERISLRGKMPKHIELWFDTTTNQLQKIQCSDISFHSARSVRYTMQIELVSTEPLPGSWFNPQSHQRSMSNN